jgi:pyruvate/2-oxoglutarate dehydrogenase complex dihydrolipoamide acyltransferase (E2) component
MMTLCFTVDHRVIDGAGAAITANEIKRIFKDPSTLDS